MNIKLLSILVALNCTLATGLSSGEEFVSKQKEFIKGLYHQKKYFDCIAETRRLLAYRPDIKDADQYAYFINANYFLGGQYKTVIENLSKEKADNKLGVYSTILLSQSYLNLGHLDQSASALGGINYSLLDNSGAFELLTRKSVIYLKKSEYKKNLDEIDNYKKLFPEDKKIGSIARDISTYKELRSRSYAASVAMSALIPGSGQIYSGRYVDGLITIIAVLAAGYGSYHFYKNDERPLSYTLGFFAALFYTGNLYGAYNSAINYNKAVESGFQAEIMKKHIPAYQPAGPVNGILK
jgi:hypothetical protein